MPRWPADRPIRLCSFEGCDRKHKTNGYCGTHALRVLRHGDPGHVSRAPNGTGHVSHNGYRYVGSGGKSPILEHRLVMEGILGRKLLPGENVHHINGDRLDNRPENLELWVVKQPYGQRVSDLMDRYLPLEDPPIWAVMC